MKTNPFSKQSSAQIFPDQVKALIDAGALLIDVREPGEFAQARIPGAILIPMSELNQRYQEIPKNGEVIIYCRSGNRSGQVVNALRRRLGYTNLLNLEGGILAWHQRGLPVDTYPEEATYQATRYEDIDVVEAKRRIDANHTRVIDVREPFEFAREHLPDAVNIPLSTLPTHLEDLQDANAILLVCNTGNRSAIAADWLVQQGLKNVANLEGGTVAWMRHGLDIKIEQD